MAHLSATAVGEMKGVGMGEPVAVVDEDVEEAAWRLMQLSNGENNCIINESDAPEKTGPPTSFSSVASEKMIKEIFGKEGEDDEGQVFGFGEDFERKNKKKKRKYRLVADIYQVTKPLDNKNDFKKLKMS